MRIARVTNPPSRRARSSAIQLELPMATKPKKTPKPSATGAAATTTATTTATKASPKKGKRRASAVPKVRAMEKRLKAAEDRVKRARRALTAKRKKNPAFMAALMSGTVSSVAAGVGGVGGMYAATALGGMSSLDNLPSWAKPLLYVLIGVAVPVAAQYAPAQVKQYVEPAALGFASVYHTAAFTMLTGMGPNINGDYDYDYDYDMDGPIMEGPVVGGPSMAGFIDDLRTPASRMAGTYVTPAPNAFVPAMG